MTSQRRVPRMQPALIEEMVALRSCCTVLRQPRHDKTATVMASTGYDALDRDVGGHWWTGMDRAQRLTTILTTYWSDSIGDAVAWDWTDGRDFVNLRSLAPALAQLRTNGAHWRDDERLCARGSRERLAFWREGDARGLRPWCAYTWIWTQVARICCDSCQESMGASAPTSTWLMKMTHTWRRVAKNRAWS